MSTKTKRMSRELASEIVNNVLRATFKDRLASLIEEENEEEKKLGDRVYLEAIPEEYLKLMRKLPATYFTQSYHAMPRGRDGYIIDHPLHRSWYGLYAIISGSYFRYGSSGIMMSDSRPIPALYQHGRWGDISGSLIIEIDAWKARYEQLFNEALELKTKIDSVMASVKTVKALLETWPDCKQYIPEHAFASDDRSLPMVVIADLNDAISKAKGDATVVGTDVAAAAVNELVKEAA